MVPTAPRRVWRVAAGHREGEVSRSRGGGTASLPDERGEGRGEIGI